MVELDFSELSPDTSPDRDALTKAVTGADQLSVAGPVPALAGVLAALRRREGLDVPVAWIASEDPLAAGLARTWGVDSAGRLSSEEPLVLGLVCDDQGGVLLARGRITSWNRSQGRSAVRSGEGGSAARGSAARSRTGQRFGAQIYHDAVRVADGKIQRVDVRPDWPNPASLKVNVHKQLWRRGDVTVGRAIQVACDQAQVEIDGVPRPRPITSWTWYADPRLRWTLISL